MATTTLTPDATDQVGGWTDEGGGTTDLHLVVDETSEDTAYIRTGTSGAPLGGSEILLNLSSPPGDFTTATAATLNIRHSRGSVEAGSAGAGDDTHTLQASIHHASLGNFVNIFTVETSTQGWAVKTENIGLTLTAAGLAATASDWAAARIMLADSFTQSMGNDGHRVWVDFVNVTLTYTEAATFEIVGWRFRNDDGSETTATWKAALNVPAWNMALDTNHRIRFRVKNTGASALTNGTMQLRWQNPGSSWANVTTSSTDVRAVASSNITDSGATTEQLTGGTGTFSAGEISEDGLVDTITVAAGNITEVEFSIQYRSADIAIGDAGQVLTLLVNGNQMTYASGVREALTQIGSDVWWGGVSGRAWPGGPNITTDGDLYIVSRTHPSVRFVHTPNRDDNEFFIWKSTDDGSTWSIVGFIPVSWDVTSDTRSMGMGQTAMVGDKLYIGWHEQGNSVSQQVYLAAWDCSDDTLEFGEELVLESVSTANCSFEWCQMHLSARSDGTAIMLNEVLNSSSQPIMDVFRRTGAATYATHNAITNEAYMMPGGYMHTNDDYHISYVGHGASSPRGLRHRVFKSDNTFSTVDTIVSTGDQISGGGEGRIVKAFNKLFVAQLVSGVIRVWYSDSVAEAPTWASVDLTNATLDTISTFQRAWTLGAFGGRVVCMWKEDSDNQLYYQQWQNGSSDFATEVATGDTAINDQAFWDLNMFTASTNDVKLGVIAAEGGEYLDLRFFSAGAPVDEGGGAAATFSGWWGFIQGW